MVSVAQTQKFSFSIQEEPKIDTSPNKHNTTFFIKVSTNTESCAAADDEASRHRSILRVTPAVCSQSSALLWRCFFSLLRVSLLLAKRAPAFVWRLSRERNSTEIPSLPSFWSAKE